MLDSRRDLKKTKAKNKEKENKLLDLTGTSQQPHYMCEDCEVELYLFSQGAILFPMSRGPHYICPQCHVITDTSLIKPPGMSEIKPIDMNPPMFSFVPDDKGDGLLIEQPYDPEPGETERLKNMGCTIKDVRVVAHSDF